MQSKYTKLSWIIYGILQINIYFIHDISLNWYHLFPKNLTINQLPAKSKCLSVIVKYESKVKRFRTNCERILFSSNTHIFFYTRIFPFHTTCTIPESLQIFIYHCYHLFIWYRMFLCHISLVLGKDVSHRESNLWWTFQYFELLFS